MPPAASNSRAPTAVSCARREASLVGGRAATAPARQDCRRHARRYLARAVRGHGAPGVHHRATTLAGLGSALRGLGDPYGYTPGPLPGRTIRDPAPAAGSLGVA